MQNQKKQSRRLFIKLAGGIGTGLFAWTWYRLSQIQSAKDHQLETRHGEDIPLGISFYGKYYLIRNEDSVRAFSTTCTHAGCRIGKGSSTVLKCGCHGSQFDAPTGKALRGPATKPLQQLDCVFDSKSNQWIVRYNLSRDQGV